MHNETIYTTVDRALNCFDYLVNNRKTRMTCEQARQNLLDSDPKYLQTPVVIEMGCVYEEDEYGWPDKFLFKGCFND